MDGKIKTLGVEMSMPGNGAGGSGATPDLCQNVTYSELVALRDGGQLTPGAFYRITDYVTTVSSFLEPKARSAGHAFDIIVLALDATTLSEDASAVAHEGDTYFNGSRLEAWKLKYRLDNVQWSQQVGTYIKDEDNEYSYLHIGEITLGGHTYKLLKGLGMYVEDWGDYALMDSLEEDATIYCYYGDPDDFDPEEPEEVGTATSIGEVTEAGQGTILWMKDEFDNECPYDFKNVQFKRYYTTDNLGRDGLDGKYMVADPNNVADKLVVEDTEDYIWAYTFSSDNSGGDQTDYSLGGHSVYGNVFKPYGELLPNNVMFGEYNYANSFGYNCFYNSWGNYCSYNSWGNSCNSNSWGNDCYYNSWGNNCFSNSWGNNCFSNSWGNGCNNNSWGNEVTYVTFFEHVYYTKITTAKVKNCQVLNGVAGTSENNKLTLNFAAQKNYTQVACLSSSGALLIYVPGDSF